MLKTCRDGLRPLCQRIMDQARYDLSLLVKSFSRMWWILPIFAVVALFKYFYDGHFPLKGDGIAERGQFGDSFGVLNSLFTGLGFGGLVVTLVLQQRQILSQEKAAQHQRRKDEKLQYEETLYRLLSLYKETLGEVSNKNGTLRGRSVLRGSIDRVFEAVKHEKINLIPPQMQARFREKTLTENDKEILDYFYFRNFKVISVEIERQGRLVDTFTVLLRHLVYGAPEHMLIQPYCELVQAQLTHVEMSYFFLVALAFKNDDELRDLLSKSKLIRKIAYVNRLRIHDYMYEHFWGEVIREYKEPQLVPMSSDRINRAVRTYRRSIYERKSPATTEYTSPKIQQH